MFGDINRQALHSIGQGEGILKNENESSLVEAPPNNLIKEQSDQLAAEQSRKIRKYTRYLTDIVEKGKGLSKPQTDPI